jgi:hypothetical protein
MQLKITSVLGLVWPPKRTVANEEFEEFVVSLVVVASLVIAVSLVVRASVVVAASRVVSIG